MERIDDNIFYTRVKFTEGDLIYMNDLKYAYSRFERTEDLGETEESEQERQKANKFLGLNSIFDIYANKKTYIPQINAKKEYYDIMLKFFLQNFDKTDRHFGRPSIIQEYFEYFNCEGNAFPFSQMFKLTTAEYIAKCDSTQLNLYIFELFSFFDKKKYKEKIPHFR